jgi:hypothetical protein
MSRYSVTTDVEVKTAREAGLMLHLDVGTVGPEGGPKVSMQRDAVSGMVWHLRLGDQVAVVDVRSLLMEAARILLEAAE